MDQHNLLDPHKYTFDVVGVLTDSEYFWEPRNLIKYADKEPVYMFGVEPLSPDKYQDIEALVFRAKEELSSPHAEKKWIKPRENLINGTVVRFSSFFPPNIPGGEDRPGEFEPVDLRLVNVTCVMYNTADGEIFLQPRSINFYPKRFERSDLFNEPDPEPVSASADDDLF